MSGSVSILELLSEELPVLDHLPKGAPVVVHVASAEVEEDLRRRGFVRLPTSVECLVSAPLDLCGYGRNLRRSLQRAQAQWDQRGLWLELTPLTSLRRAWFVDAVFHPVFASAFYRQGISPHGLQKLASVDALLERKIMLAVVRDRSERIVGAALLEDSVVPREGLQTQIPPGRVLEGLAYAFVERHADLHRALYVALAAELATRGDVTMSLGRDRPWFEPPYVGVLEQKLRMADLVAVEHATTQVFARWGDAPAPVFLEMTDVGPRWRAADPELERRLTKLTARAIGRSRCA